MRPVADARYLRIHALSLWEAARDCDYTGRCEGRQRRAKGAIVGATHIDAYRWRSQQPLCSESLCYRGCSEFLNLQLVKYLGHATDNLVWMIMSESSSR